MYLEVANFEPELRERASRTTFELKNCDFAAGAPECSSRTTFVLKKRDFTAGAAGTLFPYYFLHLEVANFEPQMRGFARQLGT